VRFDEFVARHQIVVSPVDRFAGFVVDVGKPPEWLPLDTAPGLRAWVDHDDSCTDVFRANAVLTTHHLAAGVDAGELFGMLSDKQLQSVPGCREQRRELAQATEGAGVVGLLALQIPHELGTLASVSRTRIITSEQETLIAQLTMTALEDTAVSPSDVWLTVRSSSEGDDVARLV